METQDALGGGAVSTGADPQEPLKASVGTRSGNEHTPKARSLPSVPSSGRGPDHGERPGAYQAVCPKVCIDAGQHPGCVPQDPDTQV